MVISMDEQKKKGVILGAFSSAIGFLLFVIIIQFFSIGMVGTAVLFSILIFIATELIYQNGYKDGVKMTK